MKIAPKQVAERHVMRLYKAVANYIKNAGGNVAVIGGVQLQDWGDGKFNFTVAIKCTGRKPTFATRNPK